jgi:hypothetical protein
MWLRVEKLLVFGCSSRARFPRSRCRHFCPGVLYRAILSVVSGALVLVIRYLYFEAEIFDAHKKIAQAKFFLCHSFTS